MSTSARCALLALLAPTVVFAPVGCGRRGVPADLATAPVVGRPPMIRPDYSGVVLPPNIAPTNFVVDEPGVEYVATIRGEGGSPVFVRSKTPQIRIPLAPWRALLGANRGKALTFDLKARSEAGNWRRFEPIVNAVAKEEIDDYLAYRRFQSAHTLWYEIGLYQRELTSYEESPLLRNRSFDHGCLNCHTFRNGHTDSMVFGVRSHPYGSSAILVRHGDAVKLDTKFGYCSWHPSGKVVAYSLNRVRQFFHAGGVELRDVVDLESAIAYYNVESQTAKTHSSFSEPDRLETYPTWSPDGKHLYFCSGPVLWEDRDTMPPENYEDCRYDLRRIPYDLERDEWGTVETVLSAEDTGKSILLPRVSPDGRFLLFCLCDYGCFPIYQPSSDLYLMDLDSGECRRLEINSERSESWHSWSTNSRWIAFSSKRLDGVYTRTYLSYVDENGKVHKPFVLPQKDPTFYDTLLETYSVPELIAEPVEVGPRRLGAAVRSTRTVAVETPVKFLGGKAKGKGGGPWRPGR